MFTSVIQALLLCFIEQTQVQGQKVQEVVILMVEAAAMDKCRAGETQLADTTQQVCHLELRSLVELVAGYSWCQVVLSNWCGCTGVSKL